MVQRILERAAWDASCLDWRIERFWERLPEGVRRTLDALAFAGAVTIVPLALYMIS